MNVGRQTKSCNIVLPLSFLLNILYIIIASYSNTDHQSYSNMVSKLSF